MLTSTLPRWPGDAEPGFILDLARALNARAAVELVAPHAPGAARRALLDGLPVTRFRYWASLCDMEFEPKPTTAARKRCHSDN